MTESVLSARIDFVEAIATINRFVVPGFKRYLACFPAIGADCREHLARPAVITATTAPAPISLVLFSRCSALLFSRRAASRTTLRLVGIALLRVEFLLFDSESKRGTAI